MVFLIPGLYLYVLTPHPACTRLPVWLLYYSRCRSFVWFIRFILFSSLCQFYSVHSHHLMPSMQLCTTRLLSFSFFFFENKSGLTFKVSCVVFPVISTGGLIHVNYIDSACGVTGWVFFPPEWTAFIGSCDVAMMLWNSCSCKNSLQRNNLLLWLKFSIPCFSYLFTFMFRCTNGE